MDEKLQAGEIEQQLSVVRQQATLATRAAAETVKAVQPLYDEIRELTSTAGRLRALVLNILRKPNGGRVLMWSAGVVVVPLAALLMASYWQPNLRGVGTGLVASIAAATAAVSTLAKWIRERSREVFDAIEPLMKTRSRIEAAFSEAERAKSSKLADLERKLSLDSATLETAQRELSIRNERIDAATASVREVTSGSAIAGFVQQRLASAEYQKRLGLIAVIRQDFERLCQLITGHNERRFELSQDAQQIRESLRKALPKVSAGEIDTMLQNLGINRIVIYIDDLDRCSPRLVVEVLQAIHLLLAFPVFVVIVGVDSRWMAHALEQEYPALMGSAKATAAEAAVKPLGRATPSDYLEKIFQIPFWIPQLVADGTRSLIRKLTVPKVAKPGELRTGNVDPDFNSPDIESNVSAPVADPRTPPTKVDLAPQQTSARPRSAALILTDTPAKREKPKRLELSAEELAAMGELALVIGRSPRSVTRFANTYKLLKAALSERKGSNWELPLDWAASHRRCSCSL